jgi:hypothetical protein
MAEPMYYNEMGDEITREEFESPQYHEPTPDNTATTDDSWLYNAVVYKNNADWNARMDEESKLERAYNYAKSLRGSTQTATPTGSRLDNSSYWIGKLPTLEYGTFTAPTRDPNRIGALRSRASGAGLRDLRRQTQQAIQGTSGMDATMRRMTLKDALMGYGSGVSKIMGQADRIAQAQYEDEYGDKYRESMINYTTGISKANTEFQAELQKLARNAGLGQNLNMNVLNYTKA